MGQNNLKVTADMLRALVAGASCEWIANEYGVTKSSVSQRIRALANDLQQIVGVLDVDEDESPTAALIRHHGEAYLEALEHFCPDAVTLPQPGHQTARALDQLITRIARHSRCAGRDTALLLTLFTTAAKPLEIAQLEVVDYLRPSGDVWMETTIRPDIAINRTARVLRFDDQQTNCAIDAYLAERRAQGQGTHNDSTFRGLHPRSRLFLSRSGDAMVVKRAGNASQHLVCKEIHEIYRRIFAYGGVPGVNAAFARRVAAHRLREDGAGSEEIGRALGVKKLAVHKLLQCGPRPDDQPSGARAALAFPALRCG